MSACTGWGGGMLRRTPEVLARLATQASTLASLQPWSRRRCSNQSLWTNQRWGRGSTNHSSPGTTAAPWPACSCSWPRSPPQPGLGARYKYLNDFVSRLCPAPTLAATPIMSPNLGCQTATNLECAVDIIGMCRYDSPDIYRLQSVPGVWCEAVTRLVSERGLVHVAARVRTPHV